MAERTEEQAFPNGQGEKNIFLSTMSGKCPKDYINTGSKVLKAIDLGCNYAGMAYHFLNAGLEYTGVDQSDIALAFARKKFPEFRFIESLLWALDIKEEFDLAYMQAVLQHNTWDEQEKIIPKIFNLIKPGGVWYFAEGTVLPSVAHPGMNQRLHEDWIDLMTRHGFVFEKSWANDPSGIQNIYLFTKPVRS
jgi:SAM-dependent methyltransferase